MLALEIQLLREKEKSVHSKVPPACAPSTHAGKEELDLSLASHLARSVVLHTALGEWVKGANAQALHTLRQEFRPEKSHIPLIVICTPLSWSGPISSET